MSTYAATFERSLNDPAGFWLEAARSIDWHRQPEQALEESNAPLYQWFPDGTLNTCYNALDRHVEAGRGEQVALVFDSAATGTQASYTYAELLDQVALFAGALASLGVSKGDRVIIYMPMVPEAVVAMLACARLGAVHSVVFGGFAAKELAARIDDCEPTVIVSASCGIEASRVIEYRPIIEDALTMSTHRPSSVVVLQRPQAPAVLGALDWEWKELVAVATPADPVPVASGDPLYILYTSGTTGRPKGVVRDNGGHAVAMTWSMRHVYDIGAGDVWWAASDIGWVVGHSYIVYAPLLAGATTVIYEGKPVGTPDAGSFWRVIAEHGVNALFTAPTALRAIRKDDPEALHLSRYDLTSLRTLFLAGERLDPDTLAWAQRILEVPVIDHWWQTETGWAIAANLRGIEPMLVKAGSATVPVPGFDVRILDESGRPTAANQEGSIVISLPLPPGALSTLWKDDARFVDSYLSAHSGRYLTGDSGYFDDDGYLFVMGRTDDVINVAGHRLSTGAMEEVLSAHPTVAECAVIGIPDGLKGQVPCGLVVLKAGVEIEESALRSELVAAVRRDIGPVAAFRDVSIVHALPKTRSGKVLRRTMRGIAAGREEPLPATIEDPSALDAVSAVLRPQG